MESISTRFYLAPKTKEKLDQNDSSHQVHSAIKAHNFTTFTTKNKTKAPKIQEIALDKEKEL